MTLKFLSIWIVHCPCFLAVSPNFISSTLKYNSFYDNLFFFPVGKLWEAKTYATHNERQGHSLSSLPVAVTRLDIFLQVRWMPANRYLSCQKSDYKIWKKKRETWKGNTLSTCPWGVYCFTRGLSWLREEIGSLKLQLECLVLWIHFKLYVVSVS